MSQLPPPVPMHPQEHAPTAPVNGLAQAAMIVGLVSLIVPIAAPVAIVLGLVALSKVKSTGQPGRKQAVVGIAGGAAGIVIGVFMGVLFSLALIRARDNVHLAHSMSNLRQIGQGIAMYSVDYRGHLPQNFGQLKQYLGNGNSGGKVFVSPRSNDVALPPSATDAEWIAKLVPGSGSCSYTYVLPAGPNPRVSRINRPSEYILAYETSPPAGSRAAALFADGSAKAFKPADWTKILADLSAGKNPPTLPKEPE